jgi:hypothetical protein
MLLRHFVSKRKLVMLRKVASLVIEYVIIIFRY